jgi:TP901 family phage tail tape measure protein
MSTGQQQGIAIKVQADADAAKQTLRELVQQVREAGREQTTSDRATIRAAAERVRATRQVVRAHEDMAVVGVRSSRDIQAEINRVNAAMARLARSSGTTGTDMARATRAAQARVADLTRELNGTVSAMDRFKEAAGALASLAGAAISFVVVTKKAMAFEDSLIDLRRAANLTKDEADKMAGPFKKLAAELGLTATSVVGLATAAAKTGIAKKDLLEFARIASVAAMNFDMIPEEAGKALALLKNVLKLSVKDMEAYVATLNVLADNAATSEADIIDTLVRAGSSGAGLGLNAKETAALATTILSLGAGSQQAGTAIRTLSGRLRVAANDTGKMGQALGRVVGDTKKFQQALSVDAKGALLEFLTTLKALPNAERLSALVDIFGQGLDTENISKLSDGVDMLAKSFGLAAQDNETLVKSLSDLTALKLGSTQSEVNKMSQAFNNASTALGTLFLPVVRAVAIALQAIASGAEKLIQLFPTFSRLAVIATVVVVAWTPLRLLFMALGAVGTRVITIFKYLFNATRVLATGMAGTTVVARTLGVAMKGVLGPIGLLITAAALLYDAWQWFSRDKTAEALNKQAELLEEVGEAVDGVAGAHLAARDVISSAMSDSTGKIEALAANYKAGTVIIKQALADQIAQIEENARRESEAVALNKESQEGAALESARIAYDAEQRKVDAIIEAGAQMVSVWQATYGVAENLAKESGAKIEDLDKDALEAKIEVYSQIEQQLSASLERQIANEQKYHQQALALDEQRAMLRMGLEDRVRALKQKTMTEAAAYADRAGQIEEKIALAAKASAAGNIDQVRKFADEATQLASRNAGEVVEQIEENGKKVSRVIVSEAEANGKAIDQMTRAHEVLDKALAAAFEARMGMAEKEAQGQATTREELEKTRGVVDALKETAATNIDTKIVADSTDAIAEIERIKVLAAASVAEVSLGLNIAAAQTALDLWRQDPNNKELAMEAQLQVSRIAPAVEELRAKMQEAKLPIPAELDTKNVKIAMEKMEAELGAVKTTSRHEVNTKDVDRAEKKIKSLDGIKTSSTHIVYRKIVDKPSRNREGGLVQAFAGGGSVWRRIAGRIRGAGTGTSDSIRALVSNGEYILRERATRMISSMFPGLLDRMNHATSPASVMRALASLGQLSAAPQIRMASGGMVRAPASSGTTIGESMMVTFRAGDVESRVQIQDQASKMSMKSFFDELSNLKLVAGV